MLLCFETEGRLDPARESDLFHEFQVVPRPRRLATWRPFLSRLPSEVLELTSPAMASRLTDAVKRFSPDVIVAGEPSLSGYLKPHTDRVRVLDYLMVLTLSLRRQWALSQGIHRWMWTLRLQKQIAYHHQIAPLYDLCLVNSREDEEDLRKQNGAWKQIEFVPNGLHLADYPLGLCQPAKNTLVYPGSMTYPPNRDAVQYFIDQILPRIRAEVPDVQLLVTGAIPLDGSAPQAAGVRYTGYVQDIRQVIAGAWACVVPLRSGAGGTRFKVLEAMALGTPVVSTSIGAEGIRFTSGQQLLVADDPMEFAARTVELLTSPPLRDRIARAGRRLMDEVYNWERLGANVADLLEAQVSRKV